MDPGQPTDQGSLKNFCCASTPASAEPPLQEFTSSGFKYVVDISDTKHFKEGYTKSALGQKQPISVLMIKPPGVVEEWFRNQQQSDVADLRAISFLGDPSVGHVLYSGEFSSLEDWIIAQRPKPFFEGIKRVFWMIASKLIGLHRTKKYHGNLGNQDCGWGIALDTTKGGVFFYDTALRPDGIADDDIANGIADDVHGLKDIIKRSKKKLARESDSSVIDTLMSYGDFVDKYHGEVLKIVPSWLLFSPDFWPPHVVSMFMDKCYRFFINSKYKDKRVIQKASAFRPNWKKDLDIGDDSVINKVLNDSSRGSEYFNENPFHLFKLYRDTKSHYNDYVDKDNRVLSSEIEETIIGSCGKIIREGYEIVTVGLPEMKAEDRDNLLYQLGLGPNPNPMPLPNPT